MQRFFTDVERAYLATRPDPTGHAAARIAAKEAVYKALQSLPGARAVGWREIEVTRDSEGRPAIQLHGLAAQLATEHGGLQVQVSLTHSATSAGAVAPGPWRASARRARAAQGPRHDRLRGCRGLRRRGGEPGGHRRPRGRGQRDGCRDRDRGRARRHRALLHGDRRWRLLRPPRRLDRPGRDDRRPGDRARQLRRDGLHRHRRPAWRWPFATVVVNSGLSVGVPGTPATWQRPPTAGAPSASARCSSPPSASPAAASSSTRPSTTRPSRTRRGSRCSPRPPGSSCRVVRPPRSARSSGTPTWPRPTASCGRTASTASTAAGSARPSSPRHVTPSTAPGVEVLPGELTSGDLEAYRALVKAPIHSEYRGKDVYGMPVPSSGGIAVAEILNLIEAYDERTGTPTSEVDDVQYLHRFSEASATAFADRNRWVGDVSGVPTAELVSQAFADERACLFDPTTAHPRPVPFGEPDGSYAECGARPRRRPAAARGRVDDAPRRSSTAGATPWPTPRRSSRPAAPGITVPGWGFLLNNELTDFSFAPLAGRGARPEPARRGQAPALVDEPDDGRRGRRARARGRQPGRRVDHHDGRADRPRPLRAGPADRRRARRAAALLAQRRDRAGRAGHRHRPDRRRAHGPRAPAGEHRRDRGGHRRPGARHRPLRRGGRAVPARGRLRDGGRPGRSDAPRAPGSPRLDASRAHGNPSSASIQRWRLSEPRLLLHDEVGDAAGGEARQPRAQQRRGAPPCRPGSAGWTRSRSKRTVVRDAVGRRSRARRRARARPRCGG